MNTKEERQQMKAKMPAARLGMQHTENCRVLPNRGELLYRLPNGGVVAEIGAAFGDFTGQIFDRNKPKQLHLVDAWDSDRYRAGMEGIKTKFKDKIDADRLKLHQGLSIEKLPEFDDEFFDWVYIDTNHSFGTTWKELQICDKKVKRSGRIAGHDFCTGNVVDPVPYGVVEAVTKFCADYGWQYEYLTVEHHGHFSFCLMRL
ncbi:class I SAM-dependent methyltransferase [Sinorhizobium meliloti]|uniref:class I SAM-dependent methyltransferase n=1 Tax=Rhizobium meliloti TaxID=382 RepID=UPI0002F27C39|nr:class I SAM-dependent methyltransferase [Sinorhizobium meliloti]MDE4552686.1 class I SAM-dependent methyltransferase [Sinorhizobium meliloti]MQW43251.1 class I SAM-dependent methyltransferase [Sinorhizobium meliloti]RVL82538.1 class I SAM-dependent methyltransferase [Sinorhizobium meliloti]RVN64746.1 class I SAM-dependent methyltransferase [Sinorhizobium meliloti]RVO21884.1 class I SAM-dependent methyltransferase [Sinorhizobium meliloti]